MHSLLFVEVVRLVWHKWQRLLGEAFHYDWLRSGSRDSCGTGLQHLLAVLNRSLAQELQDHAHSLLIDTMLQQESAAKEV